MKETEKVMKQVDKEERRRSKLQSSKPGVTSTPMVVRYNASPAAVLPEHCNKPRCTTSARLCFLSTKRYCSVPSAISSSCQVRRHYWCFTKS